VHDLDGVLATQRPPHHPEQAFMFAGIPEGSPYRNKPEVAQTMQRIALERLAEARKSLKTDSDGARELATSVLICTGFLRR
jgi:hypothetical protein